MKASVAIQVLPAMENDRELCRVVDEVIDYIEGEDYDQLMDVVKQCQHVAIKAGAPKVSAYVKIVYEPEGEILTIDEKVTKHHQ